MEVCSADMLTRAQSIELRKTMASLSDEELDAINPYFAPLRQRNLARIGAFRAFAELRGNRTHGETERFYEAFGLSRFEAAKVLRIVSRRALCDPQNALALPISDEVLYVLSARNDAFLQRAFDDVVIYPALTRAEAVAIVRGERWRPWARAGRPKLNFGRAFARSLLRHEGRRRNRPRKKRSIV